MSQISMEPITLNKDQVSGLFIESKTKDPLMFATVHLISVENNDTITVVSDSAGKFQTELTSELNKVQVEFIGCRTLTVRR